MLRLSKATKAGIWSSRRWIRSPLSSLRTKSTADAAAVPDEAKHPTLIEIPTLPWIGSLFPPHSGISSLDRTNFVNWWRNLHAKHGPFYSMGMPGIGAGSHAKFYVLLDPQEMMKVLKQEGAFPSGFIEREWPFISYVQDGGGSFEAIGLLGRGQDWKRLRNFLQRDLLHPDSAKEYLPGIIKGAQKASSKLPKFQEQQEGNNYVRFLNYAAMDMFSEVLFGGGAEPSPEEYEKFCVLTVETIAEIFQIIKDPMENAAHKLGFVTPRIRRFRAKFDTINEMGRDRVRRFLRHVEANENVTEAERASYLYKMLQRLPTSNVTEGEMIDLASVLLQAAADTTAAKTSWNLLQLSLNQQVQQELYEQIDRAVQAQGELNTTVLDRANTPLLSAFVRETYRCTPPMFSDLMKEIKAPTEIHGVELPAGTIFLFDNLTNMMDPELVEEPFDFRPHRWLKEQVEARKGTPQSIIDHAFYSGPFSQGARRCPGSRVALLEINALLAQLLLDYKIEGPSNLHWKDVRGTLNTLYEPEFPKEMAFVPRGV